MVIVTISVIDLLSDVDEDFFTERYIYDICNTKIRNSSIAMLDFKDQVFTRFVFIFIVAVVLCYDTVDSSTSDWHI